MVAVLLDAGGPEASLFRQVAEEAGDSGGERGWVVTPARRLEAGKGDAEHLLDWASEVLGQRRPGASVGALAGPFGHPMGDEGFDMDGQSAKLFAPRSERTLRR